MRYIKERFGLTGTVIVALTLVLVMLGLVAISTALPENIRGKLTTQIVAAAIGAVVMLAAVLIPIERAPVWVWYASYGVSLLLLVMTLISGIGTGNQSWLPIRGTGFAFQPSEISKIILIITFAKHAVYRRERIMAAKTLLELFLHAGIIIALVMLQGDLGTATVFILMMTSVSIASGVKWYLFAGALGVCAALSPVIWTQLREYQRQRILVVFNPESDPYGYGYQALVSREAIASGGLFGRGYGNAEAALKLPAHHNDMVFSYYTEEFGFIGAAILILLTAALVVMLIINGRRCRGGAGELVSLGMASLITVQASANILMCFGVIPIIGITLPFISHGGSSLISLMAGVGAAVAFGRKH